ncbi:MAG: YhcN/YlaJ family sporulation lipoprotein [Hydrogenibacillus sp.]|nr:YhcN/YlaJ family sporulation lipoprotein [Hydrogenibacillus sp.]
MKAPLLPVAALGLALALSACTPQSQNVGMGERTPHERTPANVTYRGTPPYAHDRTAPPSSATPDGALRGYTGYTGMRGTYDGYLGRTAPGYTGPGYTGGMYGAPNTRTVVDRNVLRNAMPDLNAVATRMANTAARVPGVNNATAVIIGNTAYVGLDLGGGVRQTSSLSVEQQVADRIGRAFPEYNIRVTSDKGLMQRIATLGDRLRGTPYDVDRYRTDVDDLNRHMAPAGR